MTPRVRKLVRVLVGLAATGAFLALFLRQLDVGDAAGKFRSLPWWATVAGAAMIFVNLGFMSLRWQYLLRGAGGDAHGLRPAWRERVEHAVANFVAGLGGFANRRQLGLALAASAGMWTADVVMYAIVGWAYGLDTGPGAYFLLEGVANLALAIPAAAAGIGTFDYLTLVAAQSIDIPTDVATAYVLTVHMLTVVPITIAGGLLLRRAFPRLSSARS